MKKVLCSKLYSIKCLLQNHIFSYVIFKFKGRWCSMLTLYFIRHGETEWNVSGRIQGQLDSDLTEAGIQSIIRLKRQLTSIECHDVFSSPSGRALKTANILFPNKTIKTDKRLLEMNMGQFEGLTWQEMKEKNKRQFYNHFHFPEVFQAPDGENYGDVNHRIKKFLAYISSHYETGKIFIITHGVIIKLLLAYINKIPLRHIWQQGHVKGASMTVIQKEKSQMKVVAIGKTMI